MLIIRLVFVVSVIALLVLLGLYLLLDDKKYLRYFKQLFKYTLFLAVVLVVLLVLRRIF